MSDRTTRKAAPKAKTGKPAEPRLSRTRRPAALAVADWQAALRRQFGRQQPFGLERIAPETSVASSPRRRVTGLGRPGADRGGDLLHLPRLRDQ